MHLFRLGDTRVGFKVAALLLRMSKQKRGIRVRGSTPILLAHPDNARDARLAALVSDNYAEYYPGNKPGSLFARITPRGEQALKASDFSWARSDEPQE